METIWFYAQLGFNHVLDFQGLDHFYFIIALAIPFGFREFQKLLWWVSLFTLGHTLSLFGNYFFSEFLTHMGTRGVFISLLLQAHRRLRAPREEPP
jgi:hypothetical protein